MSKHYEIVQDEEQIRKFYRECLPRLNPGEVYFISLSARNKYLTEEERKESDLGRAQMFAKTIIREDTEEAFVKHVRRFECDERGYTTRSGKTLPHKCLVCYVNIHPSSTIKALAEFQKLVTEYMIEAMSITMTGNDADNFKLRLNKIDNNLLNSYQHAHCSKRYLDFDLDINELTDVGIFAVKSALYEFGVTPDMYRIILTRSGCHILLENKHIRYKPDTLAAYLYASLRYILDVKEIIVNKNAMVPLPGTYQAGFPVKLL